MLGDLKKFSFMKELTGMFGLTRDRDDLYGIWNGSGCLYVTTLLVILLHVGAPQQAPYESPILHDIYWIRV